MSNQFSARQKKLLGICVLVYTVLYFCRLNLSAALDALTTDLGLSMARAGLLQTVFAVVYASGQMINGTIVDHVNPFRYMMLGLAGSALCNVAMSFATGFVGMIVIWTVNAIFQSMLWTPIVRVVARTFSGDQERNSANAALAVTLIAGHFFAWAISGFMADRFSWRLSFRAPGVIALATAAAVSLILLGEMRSGEWTGREKGSGAEKGASSMAVLTSISFLMVLATCVLYGFIRDGVITWTPTILAHIGRDQAISATAFSLILPLINAIGVVIGVKMRARGADPRRVVVIMMAASVCASAALLGVSGMLLTALLLGCICAAMYGANTMLTGLIPMEYAHLGKSGMTAGMIDAFIYLGSALAGVLGGSIYEGVGVRALCVVWIVSSAVSALMMTVSGKTARHREK